MSATSSPPTTELIHRDVQNSTLDESFKARFLDARADATWRAYQTDWRIFTEWVTSNTPPTRPAITMPASPQLVAQFLFHEEDSGRAKATIHRRCSSIARAHDAAGKPDPTKTPTVREALRSIRRRMAKAGKKAAQATPFSLDQIRQALPMLDTHHRVIVAVAFLSACRRSEIAALKNKDVSLDDEKGVRLYISISKTDQEGDGRHVFIPDQAGGIDIRRIIRDYILIRGEGHPGDSFIGVGDRAVAKAAKRVASILGLDPEHYSGHSFRAGFATSAAAAGCPPHTIMEQTGHKSLRTIDGYIRVATGFDKSPAKFL